MLYGELWEGHLWLHVQWIVAMVIVTLLEESVVCCLTTKHLESEEWSLVTHKSLNQTSDLTASCGLIKGKGP